MLSALAVEAAATSSHIVKYIEPLLWVGTADLNCMNGES
jgi:hypothetical protein